MNDPKNPYQMPDDPRTFGQEPEPSYDAELGFHEPAGNRLAVVGFVLALLGPLALIGVIVSAVASRRRPRGLAIAGIIVGIVMLLITAVCGGLIGSAIWVFSKIGEDLEEITTDYQTIQAQVESYKAANNGALPPDLDALSLTSEARTDPWGAEYGYAVLGNNWQIMFTGADGQSGTLDDTVLEGGRPPLTEDPFGTRWQDLSQALMEGVSP